MMTEGEGSWRRVELNEARKPEGKVAMAFGAELGNGEFPMERRHFLFLAAMPLYAGPLVLFSRDDGALIEALCAQIIPSDDAPGAREAGVVFYIDKQLAGPLKRVEGDYRRGLAALRKACREKTGREFTELPFAEQTRFLEGINRRTNAEVAAFFDLLVDHTMQGFYGAPEHGGNRGDASWKMLDIEDVMGGQH
jgi:gluconate 2-dehydrogenase gamma chain